MSKLPTSEDLAPITALLHPAYPARLREMAEILFLQLVDEALIDVKKDGAKARLAQVALAQIDRLSSTIGGSGFYMHKATAFKQMIKLSPRNQEMCRKFRGDYTVLAREYQLSEQQVRNIVDNWQLQQFEKVQGNIFPPEPARPRKLRERTAPL